MANAFRSWEISRPMSDGIQASDHIRAKRVASDLHKEGTSGHTGLFTSRQSHSPAGWKGAKNSLLNWGT